MNGTLQRAAPGHWTLVRRQAVVDGRGRIIGYELGIDDDPTVPATVATGDLLSAVFAEVGLRQLVGTRRAYVRGPSAVLEHARDLRLPAEQVVLEVTEQPVAPPLLATVSRLVAQGFHIAVGAWALAPGAEALVGLAGTVRLSFNFGTQDVRRVTSQRDQLHARGITLLAGDIQTRSEYEECQRLGFDIFHGAFLTEPERRTVPATPTLGVAALAEVLSADEAGAFDQLERIISRDSGLAHRFLRLAGSAFSSPRDPIRSIRHALARLGATTTRRWVMLLLLARLADTAADSPAGHLLGLGLHRGRLCELLAAESAAADPDIAFTAGLLSVLPALVDRSMAELVGELSLDPRLADALRHHQGAEGRLLGAVVSYENGAREDPTGRPPLLAAIKRIYATSLLWSEETRAQL